MEIEPITHLEKSIAGTVDPVTHLEKVIKQYGGGGSGGGEVTPASIVTATGQMIEDQKSQTRDNLGAMSMGDMQDAIAYEMARKYVLMTVDSGNLVLDLKDWGGIQQFAGRYLHGLNVTFVLPMQYLDQAEAYDDVLAMQLMGFNQDNGVFHFEGVRGGKRYYARMAPISANVLSGPLVIRDELPPVTTADNGSCLRVVNGSWAAAALPSAESEAY